MALDSWQKTGISGIAAIGIAFAGYSGVQMSRNGAMATGPKQQIQVHVTGAVNRQGVFKVSEGARVQDAIDAAGGTKRDADMQGLNLAEELQDGSQVDIASSMDVDSLMSMPSSVRHPEKTRSSARATSAAATNSGPISLSRASAEELDKLPGVGPSTAAKIIAYRNANGPFKTVDDLLQVKGIGPKKLNDIRPHAIP